MSMSNEEAAKVLSAIADIFDSLFASPWRITAEEGLYSSLPKLWMPILPAQQPQGESND